MNEAVWKAEPPRTILLATDLDARSDRALDRAVWLARAWKAKLVAMTVVDANAIEARRMVLRDPPSWYREQDPQALAARHLLEDASAQDVPIEVRVEQGDACERILAVAGEIGAGLIVTGVARFEALGRVALGSTVDWLVRRSSLPVLVVRQRTRGAYRRMAVASDWSGPSRHALRTATGLFPESGVDVLHGIEVPRLGMLDATRDAVVDTAVAQAREQGEAFIADCRPPGGASRVTLLVEYGDPAVLLPLYASQFPVDLAVVGSHGRSALFDIVLGSTAQRLLESAPVDTLVVRDPRAN